MDNKKFPEVLLSDCRIEKWKYVTEDEMILFMLMRISQKPMQRLYTIPRTVSSLLFSETLSLEKLCHIP
jgi:hypothetical protein